jgi:hypothetical protein
MTRHRTKLGLLAEVLRVYAQLSLLGILAPLWLLVLAGYEQVRHGFQPRQREPLFWLILFALYLAFSIIGELAPLWLPGIAVYVAWRRRKDRLFVGSLLILALRKKGEVL